MAQTTYDKIRLFLSLVAVSPLLFIAAIVIGIFYPLHAARAAIVRKMGNQKARP